eukprot:jgi/Mesen1/3302/ME000191S02437
MAGANVLTMSRAPQSLQLILVTVALSCLLAYNLFQVQFDRRQAETMLLEHREAFDILQEQYKSAQAEVAAKDDKLRKLKRELNDLASAKAAAISQLADSKAAASGELAEKGAAINAAQLEKKKVEEALSGAQLQLQELKQQLAQALAQANEAKEREREAKAKEEEARQQHQSALEQLASARKARVELLAYSARKFGRTSAKPESVDKERYARETDYEDDSEQLEDDAAENVKASNTMSQLEQNGKVSKRGVGEEQEDEDGEQDGEAGVEGVCNRE